MREAVHASRVGEQVKLQIRVVAASLCHGAKGFAWKNQCGFAAEFNDFLDGVRIPGAQVLNHNISFLTDILGHRFETLRRMLILMPVERAFLPQIEVADQQDGDVDHHLHEPVHADTRRYFYKVTVNVGPWIQKDGFHVEKNENHRDEIKSHGYR